MNAAQPFERRGDPRDVESDGPHPGRLEAVIARALGVAGDSVPPAALAPPRATEQWAPPRRHARGRRLVAGTVLVVLLAGAWLALELRRKPSPSAVGESRAAEAQERELELDVATPRSVSPVNVPTTVDESGARDALLAFVPPDLRATCRDVPIVDAAIAGVACAPFGRVATVEYYVYESADALARAYRAAIGTAERGGSGVPRCSKGQSEERAWSLPGAPDQPEGRYLCRRGNPSEVWWTTDRARVLARAIGDGDDLGALFEWWRSDPGSFPGPGS